MTVHILLEFIHREHAVADKRRVFPELALQKDFHRIDKFPPCQVQAREIARRRLIRIVAAAIVFAVGKIRIAKRNQIRPDRLESRGHGSRGLREFAVAPLQLGLQPQSGRRFGPGHGQPPGCFLVTPGGISHPAKMIGVVELL